MHLSSSTLLILVIVLILASGLFSLAEIAVISMNRYRLRHLMRQGNTAAARLSKLLERPDRLLGVILISDTFCDIMASAIATMLAVQWLGDVGTLVAAVFITIAVMIFGQMIPKTLAALYPQQVALSVVSPLQWLLRALYPPVWLINLISNGLLRLFGVKLKQLTPEHLNLEELRTIVYEAGSRIPATHQSMLLRILDLGSVTIEDVMVPRNEIIGLDLDWPWETFCEKLLQSKHTRLPVYRDDINHLQGILHLPTALGLLIKNQLNQENMLAALQEAYFIPENTALNRQLLNFREKKQRLGLVVNEYGDIQGLVSIEDILQEIVGEFFSDQSQEPEQEVYPQPDGSYIVAGSASVRDLNRALQWHLDTHGPKTLSGLIIEHLELIPQDPVCIQLNGLTIEVLEMKDNMVKRARVVMRGAENQLYTPRT